MESSVSEIRVGDKIELGGEECTISNIEKREDGSLYYTFTRPNGETFGRVRDEMESLQDNGHLKVIDTTPTVEGGNVPAESSNVPITEGAMPIGEDGNPQWRQTTPERGRKHLYEESGLGKETADTFVANKIDAAQKALDALEKQKPEVGTDLAEYQKAKAFYDAEIAEVQAELDYWNGVRGEVRGEEVRNESKGADATPVEGVGTEGTPVEGSAEGGKVENGSKAETPKTGTPVGENGGKVETAASAVEGSGNGSAEGGNVPEETSQGGTATTPTNKGKAGTPTEGKTETPTGMAETNSTPTEGPSASDTPTEDKVETATSAPEGTPTGGKTEVAPTKKYGQTGSVKAEDYQVGDRVVVYNGKGEPVEGTVTRSADSQGNVGVHLDKRIGNRINRPFNAEELAPVTGSSDGGGGGSAEGGNASNGGGNGNGARKNRTKPKKLRTIDARTRRDLETIALTLGVKGVEWVDTMKTNGEYNKRTNRMKIALDAEHPLPWVFGHEAVHRISNLSPDSYAQLKNLVQTLYGEKGWNDMVQYQQEINERAGNKLSRAGYEEEAVCDAIGKFIDDHDATERIAQRMSQSGCLRMMNELYEMLKEVWNTMRGQGMTADAKRAEKSLRIIENAFANAKKAADKQVSTPGTELTNAQGDVAATVDNQGNLRVDNSVRTYRDWTDENGIEHQGTRGRIYDYLVNKDMSAEQIDHFMENMDYWEDLSKKISDLVDENGNFKFKEFHDWSQRTPLYKSNENGVVRAVSTLVSNGEYPLNVELSTDCIKREAFTQMLNEMLKYDGRFFTKMTPAKIADLQTLQKSYGIQVACPLCFVEAKRLNTIKWATSVCAKWNEALEYVMPGRKVTPFGFGEGTYVSEIPFSEVAPDKRQAMMQQLNEVSNILSSLDGVLPEDMSQLLANRRAVDELIDNAQAEYAQKHDGSTEGFYLTQKYLDEIDKLMNTNMKSVKDRMIKAIAKFPELRHTLDVRDLLGSKGLMNIRSQNGEAFSNLYSLIVSANGTGTPKMVQNAQPYDGEIIAVPETRFGNAENVGGTRLFSFSDFDLTKVFDIMQIMFDGAARGAKIQSYSKEVPYVLLFGKCGVKINMSMLPEARPSADLVKAYKTSRGGKKAAVLQQIHENAGLEIGEDGKIRGMQLSDSHSISQEFAEAIYRNPEYNKNCGAIMVGVSANHTIYSMCQDFIRQVIPFHLSGMPVAARNKSDCIYYRDFTSTQNTGYIVNGKRVKLINGGKSINPKVDGDFNFYEGEDQPGWNMRDRCRDYINWCKENDCVPRFEFAVNSDGYRKWCEEQGYTPNAEIIKMMDERTTDGIFDEYYKVITDYTAYSPVFDAEGNKIGEEAAPHRAVTADFDITSQTLGMVLGVDETGRNINDNSMLANRERSLANASANMKEIAAKAVQILNGKLKLKDALKPGGTEFENHADNDIFMQQTDGGKDTKFSVRAGDNVPDQNDSAQTGSKTSSAVLNTSIDQLRKSGLNVSTDWEQGQAVLDEYREGSRLSRGQKRALETATLIPEGKADLTVVSSADGAKILKDIDTAILKYKENASKRSKTFLGDVANAFNMHTHGSASQYASFETKNGKVVTIRVANHNAAVRNFDNNNESEGISIVVSGNPNNGINNNGNAHVVEYFYSERDLRRADGSPLVDILKSMKQSLYSGEYTDTTGLAQRQEVNNEQPRMFKDKNGEAYGFVTPEGEVFIDPRVARDDTPIHEYSHLWTTAYRQKQPGRWSEFVRAAKSQTELWDYVKETYKDLKTDDEIADEVFAHFSGKEGAERLRALEQDIINGEGDIFEKAAKTSMLEEFKHLLKEIWRTTADGVGLKRSDRSIEEFADMTFRDLAKGKNVTDGVTSEERMREADGIKYSVRTNQVDENGDPVEPTGVATVPTQGRSDAMRQAAEKTAGRMNLKNVVYHTDTKGQTGEQAESRGWFDPATGQIHINVNNNLDEADATTTMLHEATSHYGLRKMFGKDFEKFLYNVFSQGTEDVKRGIAQKMTRNGLDLNRATEEYLAELAESQDFTGVVGRTWQNVKSLFRDMLRDMGLVSRLSDTDLREILLDSYDNLVIGGGDGVAGDILTERQPIVFGYANLRLSLVQFKRIPYQMSPLVVDTFYTFRN